MKFYTARQKRAMSRLELDRELLSSNETKSLVDKVLDLQDETKVLKVVVAAGEEQDILSVSKNKDSRKGINDFQNGRIISAEGGGSFVVEELKVSHSAAAATTEDPATKSFTQVAFPTDLENAVLQFHQNGRVIKEVKISEFNFIGDAPQSVDAQWKKFDKPFTLVAGRDIAVRLVRPSGISGAIVALGVEMKGMQTYPVRTKA